MSKEIMQQALDALEAGPDVDPIFAGETQDALRAALAAPQPEPVAKVVLTEKLGLPCLKWLDLKSGEVLYTAPPAAPSGYSTGGFNVFGDKASIDAVRQWHHDAGTVHELRQRIKPAAPSVPASQWIPCSERMPDADIEVLAWVVGEPFWDGHCWIATYDGHGWNADEDRYALRGVTAWMDLPEAPSGEGAK